MARKRKTLPEEFASLVKNGTQEEQEAMMLRCLPNAVGGYCKHNAFGYPGITEPFARWLLDYGTDINEPDYFGYSPLHHIAQEPGAAAQLTLYLRLGADVNALSHSGGGPLHGAADRGYAEHVGILLDHGADITLKTSADGRMPLEYALQRCQGWGITRIIDAVELLVRRGAPVTERALQSAKKIGEEIEFHRMNFSEETEAAADEAMGRLCNLLSIPPAPRRRFHDGVSPITVTAREWEEQYQELWDYLVPGSGPCQSVQGEVIRIIGRVGHELLDNGGCNWDRDFRLMLKALQAYLASGKALPEAELTEVSQLADMLAGRKGWVKEIARLRELSVKWVLENPVPAALPEVKYRR